MAQMKNVSELNKLTVRLFIEAVLSEGHLELIDELIDADYAGQPCAEPKVTGPAGVRQLVSSHRHAHPGLHVKIEDQIAEDDCVATRWHATVPAPKAQAPALALAGRTAYYAGNLDHPSLAGKQSIPTPNAPNLTTNPGPGGKDRRMAHSITGNPCVATQPHSREQYPLRLTKGRKVEVEAMFSPFMPALRRRARRIRLRRPAGCRIEPMPRMRWYS